MVHVLSRSLAGKDSLLSPFRPSPSLLISSCLALRQAWQASSWAFAIKEPSVLDFDQHVLDIDRLAFDGDVVFGAPWSAIAEQPCQGPQCMLSSVLPVPRAYALSLRPEPVPQIAVMLASASLATVAVCSSVNTILRICSMGVLSVQRSNAVFAKAVPSHLVAVRTTRTDC